MIHMSLIPIYVILTIKQTTETYKNNKNADRPNLVVNWVKFIFPFLKLPVEKIEYH